MKQQIVRVSPLQTAKVFAALYFVMSLPLIVLMMFSASLSGQGAAMPVTMLILMPVFYVVFGFLFTLLGAWIYNLVASRIGGIEFTLAEVAGH